MDRLVTFIENKINGIINLLSHIKINIDMRGQVPKMKRVYCLYRVSTLGQEDQNDIPMQRIDCRKFAEQQNWNIMKELLYELEVNDFEAAIIQVIFHKYVNEGLGSQRVATYLNESGIKTRTGDNWHTASIRGMLKNTTYTGILRSREARSNVIPELKIIEQETFDTAQDIAHQRSNDYQQNRRVPLNTRGQSLLSGNAYCGHCGSKLTLTTNGCGYIDKNGEMTSRKRIRYVCYSKTRKRNDCDGQTGYTMSILDKTVEDIIHQVFDKLRSIPENEIVGKKYQETVKAAQLNLNKAKTDFAKAAKELADYKAEVVKVIRGESSFSADLLNGLITTAQEKSNEAEKVIATLQNELEDSKRMLAEIKDQYNKALNWSEVFDDADIEAKKMIVSYLIKKVSVRRGYNVDIEFNIDFEQFSIGMDKK